MSFLTRVLISLLVLLGALFLGADWLVSPRDVLAAEVSEGAVMAAFQPGKGGHVLLTEPRTGAATSVSCGRVRSLCDNLKTLSPRMIVVRAVRVGILRDVWLLSARLEGRELLSAAETQVRYAGSRRTIGLMALLLACMVPVLYCYLPCRPGD
jgi:hypothetical protein